MPDINDVGTDTRQTHLSLLSRFIAPVVACALVVALAIGWKALLIRIGTLLKVHVFDNLAGRAILSAVAAVLAVVTLIATFAAIGFVIRVVARLTKWVVRLRERAEIRISHLCRRVAKHIDIMMHGMVRINERPSCSMRRAYGEVDTPHLARERKTETNCHSLLQAFAELEERKRRGGKSMAAKHSRDSDEIRKAG